MRFRDFLNTPILEGGAAIKGSSKVTQAEVREVAPKLLKKISEVLGLKKTEIAIIGSAGKKPEPSDLSGDIDVAVQCEPEVVEKKLKELAYDDSSDVGGKFKAMAGINVFSFAYPIGNKYVQVDLMPVQNLKYAEWSFQANPEDLKQGLKGAQRNELFFAIAKHMPQEILQVDDNDKPLEIKRYFYDLARGLMQGVKSRLGKKGKPLKNFSTKEKKVISNDPDKVTKLLFGDNVDPKMVSTFDGALEAIKSPKFPHKDKVNDILDLALEGIKKKGLKVPSSLTA